MSWQPTERELDLAKRLDALEAQAARPVVAGGGLLSAIANGIISHVPPKLVTGALLVFLIWHGWDYFNKWQQLSAETQALEAKAATIAADADAKGIKIDGLPLRTSKMLVEIKSLKADIARLQAEGEKVQAEADAQNQRIQGVKLAVLQKQAEVEEAEANADAAVAKTKQAMRGLRALNNPLWKSLEQAYGATLVGGQKAGSAIGGEEIR